MSSLPIFDPKAEEHILKARLLSEGAVATNQTSIRIAQLQNPYRVKRGGLSSGVKAKLLVGGTTVNFPIYGLVSRPISLSLHEDSLIHFSENGKIIGSGLLLPTPEWYGQTLRDGTPIERVFVAHGEEVAASVYEDCALFNTGNACQFCVMRFSTDKKELRLKKETQILEALSLIPEKQRQKVLLNGGMTFHPGRGMEILSPVVAAIRGRFGNAAGVAVEITPPTDLSWLHMLKGSGCNSLMMNLEAWDETARKKYIPGKDEACPRDLYLQAFEKALQIFGEGKISSCFVCGLEPLNTLKQGIEIITKLGVVVNPIAGRFFEDVPNYSFRASYGWKDFLAITDFARECMLRNNVVSTDQAGCAECGMCDMTRGGCK